MNILVTGGAGFAGRHLLHELVRRPDGDRLFATFLEETPGWITRESALQRVEWVPLDLGSAEAIEAALDHSSPDRVYHLAGQASVGQSFGDPMLTWEVNATGTLRLLQGLAARETRQRLLLVSSAEVYGSASMATERLHEEVAPRPVSPYGSSKAAAEIVALQTGATGGVEVVVARSFNHIGPGQDTRFVLPSLARQLVRIRRGESPPVLRTGNLDVERDFLDVRDVARAYLRLMDSGEPGVTYNVCSGEARSLRAVVSRLVELCGVEVELRVEAARLRSTDLPVLRGDPSRLRSLGWEPTIALDDTLKDVLAEAERDG